MSSVKMRKTNLKTNQTEVFYLHPDIEVICLMTAITGLKGQRIIDKYNELVSNGDEPVFTLISNWGVKYLFEKVEG